MNKNAVIYNVNILKKSEIDKIILFSTKKFCDRFTCLNRLILFSYKFTGLLCNKEKKNYLLHH